MSDKKPSWMRKGSENVSKLGKISKERASRLGLSNTTAYIQSSAKVYTGEPLDISKHLVELWKVLRKIVKNIIIATIVIFILPGFEDGNIALSPFVPLVLQVFNAILNHIFNSFGNQESVEIYIGSPLTPISMYINLGVFMGVILALPITIRELMKYIGPGLKAKEYETLKIIAKNALFLFLLGVGISYFLILPNTLRILIGTGNLIGNATLLQMYSISSMMNLMLWGALGGGLLYASPLILVALINLEILEATQIAARRKEIFFTIFTLAAFITPDPTIISMIILSFPMLIIVEYMITWGYKIELKKLIEGDLQL